MRQDHRFQRKGGLSDTQKRMLPVVLIPLIVIILMIVIVIADHPKGKEAGTSEPALSVQEAGEQESAPDPGDAESQAEPGGEADEPENSGESEEDQEPESGESKPEETEAASVLQRDTVPEIRDLMARYFQARATADAAAVNQIYGVGEVPDYMLEIQKVRLANNAKYLSGIGNVVTYVMDGQYADSWLVYSTADLQFYAAKTAAPMIMWCYVTKDAEGNYHIANPAELSEEVLQYVDAVNRSREIRQLAADVNNRLKEALSSDEDLNEVYGILHDGSPVWTGEGETQPEVVILEGEETAGAENGTEAASETVGEGSAEGAGEVGSEDGAEGAGEAGSESSAEGAVGTGSESSAEDTGEAGT